LDTKIRRDFSFNPQVEKGRIIEVLTREIDRLNAKQSKLPTMNEKIADVAAAIRNEIKELPDSRALATSTDAPSLLFELLKKVTHHKSWKVSKKKVASISSIYQDIIYCSSNTRKRTKKHVYLSLCVKRKTGSKEVLTSSNRLGHGISYD
jgi:hypothetical protein